MRTVLVATGEGPDGNPLDSRRLLPMLPLLDRPFVQHVLEYFVGQGVREFDVVLSHLPEVVEDCLGDGARWGCRLTYHLARNPACPYRVLSRLGLESRFKERVLLGHADRLPIVQLPSPTRCEDALDSLLFVSPGRPRQIGLPGCADEWTGWGLLPARELLSIPPDLPAVKLYSHLRSTDAADVHLSEATTVLSVRTAAKMLEAQRAVLDNQVGGLMFRGLQRAPRVWVAGSAKVSPTAKLIAPVFIGSHCTVGDDAHLGPHTVIAAGCLIDRHCHIRNSSVLSGSYVGEGMVLDGAVVDRDLAVNARANSATLFADPLTLGRVPAVSLASIVCCALARILALALLIATTPLLLLLIVVLGLLRGGRVFHSRNVVCLPLLRPEGQWPTYRLYNFGAACEGGGPPQRLPGLGHLLLDVLPGLIHIVRGELHFVGVSPRSPEEVRCLPQEWRTLYLNTKAGLVSPTALLGPAPTGEDQFAADAGYAVNRSWRQDLQVLAAYLWRAFWMSLRPLFLAHGPRFTKEGVAGTNLPERPETVGYRTDEAAPAPCNGAGSHWQRRR